MCFLISIQVLQYVFHVMPFEILCHHLWQNHLLNHKTTENATPFLTWYKVSYFPNPPILVMTENYVNHRLCIGCAGSDPIGINLLVYSCIKFEKTVV